MNGQGMGDYITPMSPSDPTPGYITSMDSPLGAGEVDKYWEKYGKDWRNWALVGSAAVVLFLLWRLSKKG